MNGKLKSGSINVEACEQAEDKIIEALNGSKLSLRELVYTLAHTLIDVGGSLEGLEEKLTQEDMWRRYATDPTLGNALIAMGADMLHDWIKIEEEKGEKNGEDGA